MIAILTLVVIMFLSLLATRIATAILMHTGMSHDNACFQARSAWTNSGFTTSRSECMVNHPIRRRVLMILMLGGNVGLATTSAAFIVGMADNKTSSFEVFINSMILVAGIILMLYLSKSRFFSRFIDAAFDRFGNRILGTTKPGIQYFCHFSDDCKLLELTVSSNNNLTGKKLRELKLDDYEIVLLQLLKADNTMIENSSGEEKLESGMKLILFGHDDQVGAMLEKSRGKKRK